MIEELLKFADANANALNVIVATALAIISIVALFVAIASLWIQRRHNRKSVRPLADVLLTDSIQGLTVRLVNRGCGPMKVTKFVADRAGDERKSIVHHLPGNALKNVIHTTHSKPKGEWIIHGNALILLQIRGDHNSPVFIRKREYIRSILREITIKLSFADIYDKSHGSITRSLEWFRREL
jgi:hypothetical protein